MATMKDMFSTCLEKIERQAKKIALLEDRAERAEKLAAQWEARVVGLEKKITLECQCEHADLWQQMDELGEANQHLLAENTQMRALLVGWFGLTAQRGEWPAGTRELVEATREYINPREKEVAAS